jgi:transcriptional regulator with XRE-family HTH domain
MKNNLRSDLRRRAGLTQLQLARLTNVTSPRISLWENNEIELRPEEVECIAQILYKFIRTAPLFKEPQDIVNAFRHPGAIVT